MTSSSDFESKMDRLTTYRTNYRDPLPVLRLPDSAGGYVLYVGRHDNVGGGARGLRVPLQPLSPIQPTATHPMSLSPTHPLARSYPLDTRPSDHFSFAKPDPRFLAPPPPPLPPSPKHQSPARFQQRQLQEKEQKLLQMLENQQQRALQRVGGRGSAGSSTSSNSSTSSSPASSTGKVRLMFEERRTMHSSSTPAAPSRRPQARSGPAATTGWDRSYPLDPLAKTSRSIPAAASAGRPAARPGVPKPTRTKPDLDVSLRPVRATRDTNANQVLSPNDDLPAMFGKLANVGLRNGGANNNFDDDSTDTPVAPARKPTVKALAEPKIRPAPAKRVEQPQQTRSPVAPAASRPSPVRRPTPPSPVRSSNSSSSATTPEPLQKTSRSGSASNSPAPAANLGPLPPGMAECSMCGRRFNEERIGKHEDICRKTKTKKRKVFDPVKMRVQGTDVEAYFKKTGKKPGAAPALLARKPPSAASADKKGNWRKKHEEFIESIREAKKVQQHLAAGGKVSDLPPPKPMDTSDYVQCPHCNRKFSEGAAERHIPRCANIKSNKPAPTRAPPRKR